MLSKEEVEALSACVGSAIGEFGASETTDLAIQAIRKLESGLTPRAVDVATAAHKIGCAYPVGMCNCGAFAKTQRN